MTPMQVPWNTDIVLGSIDDLGKISYNQRKSEMILREIPDEVGNPLKLKWPIKVLIEKNEDYFYASNEDLNLLAYGKNKDECLANFHSLFIEQREHFMSKKDNELMGRALRLKALFSSIAI
jgi:hypothetical protein